MVHNVKNAQETHTLLLMEHVHVHFVVLVLKLIQHTQRVLDVNQERIHQVMVCVLHVHQELLVSFQVQKHV